MEYFKDDGKFICLEAPYAEFYLPNSYFEGKFADDLGNIIRTLGIFNVGLFVNGELKEIRVFNVPTFIDLFVGDYEERSIKFGDEEIATPCKVLRYNKGDKIMNNTIIEDSENAEKFVGFINAGKLPNSIPYSKALEVWLKNMNLNSVNLGVPYVIYELILSASYRYKKDPTQKFGYAAANDMSIGDHDYVMSRIREICRFTSTFTGVTFEDIDAMITTSLNRTKTKTEEPYSPVEGLLKL